MYSFIISGRKINNGKDQVTSIGRQVEHIKGMYNRCINNIQNNIESLYVFDGPPPEIKKNLMRKRRYIKDKARDKIEEIRKCSYYQDDTKYKQKTVELTKNVICETQKLIHLFGIPYIEALNEGEMQCAAFCNTHYAVSDDWDTLVFGSSYMIKNINFRNKTYTKISLEVLLQDLGLTHEQFIEVCILMGCDYCPKIKGIYFEIYSEYIKYNDAMLFIESLREENKQYQRYIIPENYIEQFNAAKEFYQHGIVIDPQSKNLNLEWSKPDYEGIINYLCDEFEFDRYTVTEDMKMVEQKYNSYIKGFF